MKKLLILNGGHSDIPLIKAGKELGYYVITTGNRPDLVGHKYADEYINADFSDCEAMARIAEDNSIDAVCACANDFGAISASYVAEKLGLPGHDPYETTLRLHHKDKFKEMARKINLQTPASFGFDSIDTAIDYAMTRNYELIIKPIDLTGGKGISRAITPGEIIESINRAFETSPHHRIVVEQFINGTYHSMSAFIVNRKVVCTFCNNEFSYASPFYVSTSGGPANNAEKVMPILSREIEKVANELDLVDGNIHVQYVMDETGKPYIMEMARRASGDMYSNPVSKALGIDSIKWLVKAECGYDCSDFPKGTVQKGFCGYHAVIAPKNGLIRNYSINPKLEQYIYDRFIWFEPGYEISDYLHDKIGVIFYSFPSREIMDETLSEITSLIRFEYE